MYTPVVHIMVDDEGIPRTINRRVKVRIIAQQHINGHMSISTIAEHHSITDVYAALAYYHDNREYFDKIEQELQPLIDKAKQYTSDLQAKIAKRMQDNNNQ